MLGHVDDELVVGTNKMDIEWFFNKLKQKFQITFKEVENYYGTRNIERLPNNAKITNKPLHALLTERPHMNGTPMNNSPSYE